MEENKKNPGLASPMSLAHYTQSILKSKVLCEQAKFLFGTVSYWCVMTALLHWCLKLLILLLKKIAMSI